MVLPQRHAVATPEALQAAAQAIAAAKTLLQRVAGTQSLCSSASQMVERLQTTLTQAIDQIFSGSIEQQLEAILRYLFCDNKLTCKTALRPDFCSPAACQPA